MKKKKIKLLVFKICVPLFAILFMLLLFEIFLRIIDYNPLKYINEKADRKRVFLKQSSNKYLRYELNPGFKGIIDKNEIRINSHGFRGREFEIDKKNKFRICVLGDSITFAIRWKESDLFTRKLEGYFLLKNSMLVEVLNLAVTGYDTLQEVKYFEKIGLKFSPDLVIVAYCLNDIGITPLSFGKIKSWVSMKRSLRIVQFVKLKLNKLSLINELRREMNSLRGHKYQFQKLYKPVSNDPVIDRYMEEIRQSLEKFGNPIWLKQYASPTRLGKIRFSFEELKNLSEENNFQVVVVIFPFLIKPNQQYKFSKAHKIIRHEAERNGFRVIDMTQPFKDFGFSKLTYDNVHLSVMGHKLTAQILYKELIPIVMEARTKRKR